METRDRCDVPSLDCVSGAITTYFEAYNLPSYGGIAIREGMEVPRMAFPVRSEYLLHCTISYSFLSQRD